MRADRAPEAQFCEDPAAFFDNSYTAMQSLPRPALADLQLAGLRLRFTQLRDRIPVLKRLADAQGVERIDTLHDIVPLLFEHTMYKSYPPSLIEKGRFSDICRWLSRLLAFDLSNIDVSGCTCIDDWVAVMDEQSPLTLLLSSGTTGTMSLMPVSKSEYDKFGRLLRVTSLQRFGEEWDSRDAAQIYCIYPYFRYGASAHLRTNDLVAKYIAGCEERLFTIYPGKVSSDVLFLAARMRAAQNRGDLDRLKIPPHLLQRKEEYEQLQREMPRHLDVFFEEVVPKLRGKRIFTQSTWNLLGGLAQKGLEKGFSNTFAPNSIVGAGGGAKGMEPSDDWMDLVRRFVGVDHIDHSYGTGEILGLHKMCVHGRYHFAPWVIPFLLDSETSKPLPRVGVVTGRVAFFDLGAETRWGGFVTGDEVTIDWSEFCPCGQESHFMHGDIRRFSENRGGDDKISCAATEGAHRDAVDFLNRFDA